MNEFLRSVLISLLCFSCFKCGQQNCTNIKKKETTAHYLIMHYVLSLQKQNETCAFIHISIAIEYAANKIVTNGAKATTHYLSLNSVYIHMLQYSCTNVHYRTIFFWAWKYPQKKRIGNFGMINQKLESKNEN